MSKKRLLIWSFYLLTALLFTAIASTATLYAAGYSINFKNWSVEKTGILVLHTQPSGASIELNGKKLLSKTPVSIHHLLPQNYQLNIKYPGYHSFRKKIKIEPGLITEENYVVLFFAQPSPTGWQLKEVKNAFLSPSKGAILIQKNTGDLIKLDLNNKKETPLLHPDDLLKLSLENRNFIAQASIDDLLFSPDENNLFLRMKKNSVEKEIIIENGKITVLPRKLTGNDVQTAFLTPDGSKYLRLAKNKCYFVDGNKMTLQANNIKAVAAFDNEVFYIEREQSGQDTLKKGLPNKSKLFSQNLPQAQSYKLNKVGNNIFLTTINQGTQELWVYSKKENQFQKLTSGYIGKLFPDGQSVFYQTPYETITYNPNPEEGENKIKTITRLAQPLNLIEKNERELFFIQENNLKVIKTDGSNNWLLIPDIGNKIFINQNSTFAYQLKQGILSEIALRDKPVSTINNFIQRWRARLT